MVESRLKFLVFGLIIGSLISGYFSSAGSDLWQLTKATFTSALSPSDLPLAILFWIVSVPMGLGAIGLLIYDRIAKQKRKFRHLTIHYSQSTDTPDTPSPARPRYVTNNTTKHAYWVSTQLEKHIKKHLINWHTHESGLKLNNYLLKNQYTIHDQDATPEELGVDEL